MYRLVVVSGPNLSSAYSLHPGETSLGRQLGNTIVLSSSKISKRHCSFQVSGNHVTVQDLGSSNGTFINGVLTKTKALNVGDRVTVGEYVFELASTLTSSVRPETGTGIGPGTLAGLSAAEEKPEAPKDLRGKAIWAFDTKFMPFFYGFSMKNEWRMVCVGLFVALILGNMALSLPPLLESSRESLIKETKLRARFMARQIAEQNAQFLAARAETKTDIGSAEHSDGVRVAVLTDLDNRIIAPGSRLNEYLTSGAEALFAIRARDLYRQGRETGMVAELDSDTVVAIEPVKILNPAMGKNVVSAMAIVSIDTSLSTPGIGDLGIIYFETLILTGLFGGFIFLILYKVTLKPFQVLNEDMDRALKGDLMQVTHEYKIEELDSLWEIINSAIQRIPSAGESNSLNLSTQGMPSIDEYLGPLKMFASLSTAGVAVLDSERKIAHINGIFEEISGIRSDAAIGQTLSEVARDQGFGAFASDILGRVGVGGEGISEEYDFSGIAYKVHVAAFGSTGQSAKCYLFVAARSE